MSDHKPIRAWHFTGNTLRDDAPIPAVGEPLTYEGPLIICQSGLHASVKILDALKYAPGDIIHRVECSGDIEHADDKLVCHTRTILWSVDAEDLLRPFALWCALQVIHLWDAPDIVREYLETGDETKRAAAAASAAAWAAVDAASAAAIAAASCAARDAAWASASAAAWAAVDAASAAAKDAQEQKLLEMVTTAHDAFGDDA